MSRKEEIKRVITLHFHWEDWSTGTVRIRCSHLENLCHCGETTSPCQTVKYLCSLIRLPQSNGHQQRSSGSIFWSRTIFEPYLHLSSNAASDLDIGRTVGEEASVLPNVILEARWNWSVKSQFPHLTLKTWFCLSSNASWICPLQPNLPNIGINGNHHVFRGFCIRPHIFSLLSQ